MPLRDDQGWFGLGPNLTDLFAKGFFGLALLACPFLWARSYGFMPRGLQVPGKPRFMAGLAIILAVPLVLPLALAKHFQSRPNGRRLGKCDQQESLGDGGSAPYVSPMPELPEVETTVAGLRQVLDGASLTRVEPRRPDMRFAFPVDLRQRLTGATVTSLGRRAKYGLIDTDRGDTMIFHLGMSGRWRIDPSETEKHDHLIFETPRHRLALHDPRRFGFVDLVTTASLATYPAFAAMGPEPLGDALTADYLARKLQGRIAPIKAMLLDQRIVAGLGNIYVCEALNIAGNRPDARGGEDRQGATDQAGACNQARAACRNCCRRIDPARLCPAGRRARLFRQGLARLWPRGRGLSLRRHGQTARG